MILPVKYYSDMSLIVMCGEKFFKHNFCFFSGQGSFNGVNYMKFVKYGEYMNNELCKSAGNDNLKVLKIAVFVIMGIYFFVNFHRSVIPGSIFTTLQSEFNTSGANITAMGAAFMYIYAISQLFIGTLVDRYGGVRIILVGGVVFCIGAVLLAFVPGLWGMYFCRAMLGIGAGFIYLSMVAVIRRAFPESFPTVLGIALMVGYAGTMTANGPFVIGAEKFGWRYIMGGAGFILLGIFIIFCLISLKISFPAIIREKISLEPFREVLREKCNYRIFSSVAISFGTFMVIFTVCGKKFLEDFCGMETVSAGLVMTGLGALSALSSLLSPILCRMIGNRRKPFIVFIGIGTFIPLCVIVAALLMDWRNWSFSNFFAYAAVAIFGSAAGFLMDIYPPEIIDGIKVYGRNSYLILFSFFAVLCSFAVYYTARIQDVRK